MVVGIMNDFEEAINPYLKEKIIDEDNNAVVKYKLKTIRVYACNIHDGVQANKKIAHTGYITPLGHFSSVKLAAQAQGCSVNAIYGRIKCQIEGYSYG